MNRIVLLLAAFLLGVCFVSEATAQDPPVPESEVGEVIEYRPIDPSRLPGIDPVGQQMMRDRARVAELEGRYIYAMQVIRIQQRQIAQLQQIVFGLGTRSGAGIAPVGQEPIGMPPEIDAGIAVPVVPPAPAPIGQAPIGQEPNDGE